MARGISILVRPHGDRMIMRVMVDDDELLAKQLDAGEESRLDKAARALDEVLGDRNPGPLARWLADVIAGPTPEPPPPGPAEPPRPPLHRPVSSAEIRADPTLRLDAAHYVAPPPVRSQEQIADGMESDRQAARDGYNPGR